MLFRTFRGGCLNMFGLTTGEMLIGFLTPIAFLYIAMYIASR